MEKKKVIFVQQDQGRQLQEAVVATTLELTPAQQAELKRVTGKDITQLKLTKAEVNMIVSPAGYDAPGAGIS